MNSLLTWRKSIHGNWLLGLMSEGRWRVRACIGMRDGDWVVCINLIIGRPGPAIRCRNLHEAADCARRWAEYRGFKVASRFPEGGAA